MPSSAKKGSIHREYLLPMIVAVVAGVLAVVSLYLPWFGVGENGAKNAFQAAEYVAEQTEVAFVGTSFSFMILFGVIMIVGAILMLTSFEVGSYVTYGSATLSIIFTVIGLIVASVLPSVTPLLGAWMCLCCGIAGVISPKLRRKKE